MADDENVVLIKKEKPKKNFLEIFGIDVEAEKNAGTGKKQVHDDLEDLCLRIREKVLHSAKKNNEW